MPPQPTSSQTRYNNMIICFTGAVNTLELLADSFKVAPFLEPISNTARSLLSAIQAVKNNKDDCIQLMEQTHGLLDAVVSVHLKSTTGPELPPSMLDHLGKFTEHVTLHKLHSYVEAQQAQSQIQQFFRKGEMKTLLKACRAGLQEALEVFEVQNIDLLRNIADIKAYEEERHQEVLQMIENLSDASNSDTASSRMFSTLHNSSTSISMLPSQPKIFHGRESELADILNLFKEKSPRIAILGPGGMGKTSLAKAVLHHPQVKEKFDQHRYFVACDSVSTKAELVSLIGAHLGLKPGKDLTSPIIQFLSRNPASLLTLDNLETVWDPIESRRDVEEFLSLLTDVEHMTLLVKVYCLHLYL
ncbi:hypothetical protein C8R43DRAFT_1141459 [Mycena crocata]|nr:hypothetical protein C8R43DRAFT_1141459 [Mycena crocata]